MPNHSGYDKAHHHARKILKTECQRCGRTDSLQAALDPSTPAERLLYADVLNVMYSETPTDYLTLCVSCHAKMDASLRTHCIRGHERVEGNFSVRKDGSRRCLVCHREDEARRLQDPVALERKRESQRVNRKPLTPEQRARKTALQQLRRQKGK